MTPETCFRSMNGKPYADEADCLLHDFLFTNKNLSAKLNCLPVRGGVEYLQGVLEDARRLMIDLLRIKCEYDAATTEADARKQVEGEENRQRLAAQAAEDEERAKRRPYVRIIGRPQPLTIIDVTTIRGVTHYLFGEYPMMWISTDKVTGVPYGDHPAEQKPSDGVEPTREERAA